MKSIDASTGRNIANIDDAPDDIHTNRWWDDVGGVKEKAIKNRDREQKIQIKSNQIKKNLINKYYTTSKMNFQLYAFENRMWKKN